MYGRLLLRLLPCPLVLSGCALIGYDLDDVGRGPDNGGNGGNGGNADGGVLIAGSAGSDSHLRGSAGYTAPWWTGAGGFGASRRFSGWGWTSITNRGFGGFGSSQDAGSSPLTAQDASTPLLIDAGVTLDCTLALNGTPCEDGLFCTVNERCVFGACAGGDPRDCSGLAYTCHDGVCSETMDACIAKPGSTGDTSMCPEGEYCVEGACAPGELCPGGTSCDYSCPDASCNYNCTDSERCRIDCPAGASCHLVGCWHGGCELDCAAGSSCLLNCIGSDRCRVRCNADAECALNCHDASDCGFDVCDAPLGEQGCSDPDWTVCNHECP